jgi:lysophospholipase L1-like esterase
MTIDRTITPTGWTGTWAQALPDVRADSETFTNVTLRSTLRIGVGGNSIRIELNNRFGDQPLLIGNAGITSGDGSASVTFNGQKSVSIPAGGSIWSDPILLPIEDHGIISVEFYLPEPTSFPPLYGSVSEFTCEMSEPGDHVGAGTFPAVPAPPFPMPDDAQISVHESGPFLRTVAITADPVRDVVVCLGDSITAMGWPEEAARLLPTDSPVSIVNRGIPGNRLRLDAGPDNLSNGRSGLTRFQDDVLGTPGVTAVVIALGTNDLGLPGEFEPLEQLPTAAELIAAYEEILDLAIHAGLAATIATIGPRQGSDNYDDERERVRTTVNEWIRGLGPNCLDFDNALQDPASPLELDPKFDSGDHLHPSDAGQAQLGRTAIAGLTTLLA